MTTDNFYLQQIARSLSLSAPPPGGAASEATLAKLLPTLAVLNNASPEWNGTNLWTVPVGQYWEILTMFFQCNTNATVGNRRLGITFFTAANDLIQTVFAPADQPASLARLYHFHPGSSSDALPNGIQRAALPGRLLLPPQGIIFISDVNAIGGILLSVPTISIQRHFL